MTQILTLTFEKESSQDIGIILSDGITPQRALEICTAVANHFRSVLLEAEVQRRLEERIQQKEELDERE